MKKFIFSLSFLFLGNWAISIKPVQAQLNPPDPNGGCFIKNDGNWIENCYEGVQWQQIPNSRTYVGGYDEGYSYVGINTISRTGDAINFDFFGLGQYLRYTGNCRTQVLATVRASDAFIDPNTYYYVGKDDSALNIACLVSENSSPVAGQQKGKVPISSQTKLTLRGFGSVQIGMTINQAQQATGQRFHQIPSGNEPYCLYYETSAVSNVSFMVIEGKISRIDVDNPNITTPSGARIGYTERQIYDLYPGQIKSTPHQYIRGGHYLSFIPNDREDSNYRIIFETDGQKVITIRSGKLPDVEWIERCA